MYNLRYKIDPREKAINKVLRGQSEFLFQRNASK